MSLYDTWRSSGKKWKKIEMIFSWNNNIPDTKVNAIQMAYIHVYLCASQCARFLKPTNVYLPLK